MIRIISTSFFISLFMLMNGYAQAPQKLNYQGVARDNSGNILASQNIGLRITIRQGSPAGTITYCESHAPQTNAFGLFALSIGSGTVIAGSMDIDWSNGPYFVETEMDASGGSTYLSLGTQQLLAVPYALYSSSSADNQWEKVDNTDNISNKNTGNVGVNELMPYATLHVSRPVNDPSTSLSLIESTGIAIIGPITDNIVADYRGIQARHGDYTPALTLVPSGLNLQPLGGGLVIHSTYASDEGKLAVTSAGRFGIGTLTPESPLHIVGHSSGASGDIAAQVINSSTTTSTAATNNRIGLQLQNNGAWGGNAASKNIGLYVSEVSGQTASETNIAAVLNGNVVIGDITGSNAIGTGGSGILAIQNGIAPASLAGGIQLYSENLNGTPVSVFNVMNGDGTVIQLYRQADLTASDASSVSSSYGATEAAVINNMRTRIDELEARLKNLGLMNP